MKPDPTMEDISNKAREVLYCALEVMHAELTESVTFSGRFFAALQTVEAIGRLNSRAQQE